MIFVSIAYDVSDDRRRRRVSRVLEDFGTRVQFSVFDCQLEERALLELRELLAAEIDQSLDGVRFYRLCRRCRGHVEVMGLGRILEERDILIL